MFYSGRAIRGSRQARLQASIVIHEREIVQNVINKQRQSGQLYSLSYIQYQSHYARVIMAQTDLQRVA